MARILEVQSAYSGPPAITAEVTTERELNMLGYRKRKPPKRYQDPLRGVRRLTVNVGSFRSK